MNSLSHFQGKIVPLSFTLLCDIVRIAGMMAYSSVLGQICSKIVRGVVK